MKAVLVFAIFLNGNIFISAMPQFQFNNQKPNDRPNFIVAAATAAHRDIREGNSRSCCTGSSSSIRVQQVAAPANVAQNKQEELVASGASFGQEQYAQRPQSFGTFNSGGSQGGNLQVECQRREVAPGQHKFICEGVQKELITLRSEHILWLQNNGGQSQVLDIEVPNYKIDELIKAGFKATAVGGTRINVLLKKPEQSYDAEVDIPAGGTGTPSVNLQYEPVQNTVVHFPVDKPYRPLSGPILPPAGTSTTSAGGRFQRQAKDLTFSKRVA